MSALLFPQTIPGLTYDVLRTPEWNTGVQTALSKKRSTIAWQLYPVIHFELNYELLRDDPIGSELKSIVGLFNAVQGRYDTFLFADPDFNSFLPANAQLFGIGDGSTRTFQLVGYYQNGGGPGYPELIQNLNGTPFIYDNGGLLSSGYSVGPTGLVTFTSAPAVGHQLTWAGAFFYRCAFDDDKLDIRKFMNKWWALPKIAFTSIKL
jgi:uncharacterized protein (TIGR02217 family)